MSPWSVSFRAITIVEQRGGNFPLPTQRSATPFCQGFWIEVRTQSIYLGVVRNSQELLSDPNWDLENHPEDHPNPTQI
jgi:hypothetical protein